MSYIEENAFNSMVNIFSTISNEKKIYFDGYFATDMFKINGKPCVYPCFLGFNSTSITIVQVNLELEKEKVQIIQTSCIKHINTKKMFLSKNFYLKIECNNNTSFVLAVVRAIKYIPSQSENTEKFLRQYPF